MLGPTRCDEAALDAYRTDPPTRQVRTKGRTGYGLKYRGARVQPLTRGPEADETKTMTVALPHRV